MPSCSVLLLEINLHSPMDVCFTTTILHKILSLYLQSQKIWLLHESLYKANTKPLHRIQSSICKIYPVLNRKAFLMLQASRYLKGIKIWCIATLDHRGFYSWRQQSSTPKGSCSDPHMRQLPQRKEGGSKFGQVSASSPERPMPFRGSCGLPTMGPKANLTTNVYSYKTHSERNLENKHPVARVATAICCQTVF